ncbi:MAG: hypothetical protein IPJ17_10735 [Holophagales bacterium]|nr:MAG: hypothetical protein IPJ17_10735 [Holophagales bacterium]
MEESAGGGAGPVAEGGRGPGERTGQRPASVLVDLVPALCGLGVAVGLAVLLGPAVMSTDSILQYQQALTGSFDDWHPPLMAIVLSGFLAAGPGLRALGFLQCLAAVFGVLRLATAILAFCFGDRLTRRRRGGLALGVLLLLLLPVSAWPFYFMTFWTDVWLMIGLLWIGASALDLFRRAGELAPPAFVARLAALVLLMAVTATVRHNASPLLLPFGLIVVALLARFRGRSGGQVWPLVAAPLALFLVIDTGLARGFAVQHEAVGNLVMALDLVGVCATSDRVCADLPVTRGALEGDLFKRVYRAGEIEPLYEEEPRVARPELFSTSENPALAAEYRHAVRHHPVALAGVKLRAFVRLLGLDRTVYFFTAEDDPNDLGLALDEHGQRVRERWAEIVWHAAERPLVRWASAVHALWIAANLVWVGGVAWRWGRSRRPADLFLLLVLLVPLAYDATYLLAVVALDYRYMAPATLWVQVVSLSAGLGTLAARLGRSRAAGAVAG